MHSISSKGLTFTVSTGGRTFVAPSTPLGISTYEIEHHFIPPVPPTYVTEYQDKYKWPVIYTRRSKQPSLYTLPKAPPTAQAGRKHWTRLLGVVDELLDKGYETNLLRPVREQVAARRFDSLLEFATAHFRDAVSANQPELEVEVEANGARNGTETVATSANITALPPDLLQLCKEFLACVEAIKSV